jgi:hypothetical protein
MDLFIFNEIIFDELKIFVQRFFLKRSSRINEIVLCIIIYRWIEI